MNSKRILATAAVLTIGAATAAVISGMGRSEPPAKEAPKGGSDHMAPQARSAAMDSLKKLAGTWEMPEQKDKAMPAGTSIFKVTSGGTMVQETMAVGTPHEMTNTYHMDGKNLVVTHYCAAGNQPRMQAVDPMNAQVLHFKFRDGTNLDPAKDGYMGELKITIIDADHIKQEWTYFKDGKASTEHQVSFEMSRKK